MSYRMFTRTWWKRDKSYPGGLRPHAGRKSTKGYARTEEEARAFCRQWNANHDPGPLSLKCEYEGG